MAEDQTVHQDPQKFVYKATKDGTLSNPFTFVKKDQTVVLSQPIEASWLTPIQEYVEPAELPVTATSEAQKQTVDPEIVQYAEPNQHGDYSRGMEDIKAKEAQQDAEKSQDHVQVVTEEPAAQNQGSTIEPKDLSIEPQDVPQEQENEPSGEGTGTQDVLG